MPALESGVWGTMARKALDEAAYRYPPPLSEPRRDVGPLHALLAALERRRALFWTGHTLVEFDHDFTPPGQVTMVLDEDDYEDLKRMVARAS